MCRNTMLLPVGVSATTLHVNLYHISTQIQGLLANQQSNASSVESVSEIQLRLSLLIDWHCLEIVSDALVEISPCTMQTVPINHR